MTDLYLAATIDNIKILFLSIHSRSPLVFMIKKYPNSSFGIVCLINWKLEQKLRNTAWFPMFDWVGGRTLEISSMGLLLVALQVSAFPFSLC